MPILGSGEEFAETQLRACCRDLPGEMLNTGRGNYSEGKLIYFIQTEGKGKGEDNLCLAYSFLLTLGEGRDYPQRREGRR